jgi:tRNA pseudouridine13 synthase
MSEATPPDEEKAIGLGCYITKTDPLGGKLKKLPEDFQVSEIALPPPLDPSGEFTIAKIKVYNWETNRLIRAFSKRLMISRRRIGFAGTKDKRAVTTQLFSFRCPEEQVRSMGLKDVFIIDTYRSNKPLEIGDLQGNNFQIRIRDIGLEDGMISRIAGSTSNEIKESGGFPNYFGIQRFGSIRPITHVIGRHIIKSDFKRAVMDYIGNPGEFEKTEGHSARRRLDAEMDFKEALDYYPQDYIFERSMIYHLIKNPDDWIGAIEQLPDNLRMMFVHAYQSFLFNRILTSRLEKGLSLSSCVLGDIVLPLNKNLLPDHRNYITVTQGNIQEVSELVKRRKAFISGLIVGYEAVFADGEMGEIERKVIAEEGADPSDFMVDQMVVLSSKGIRRELLSTPFDLRWRVSKSPIVSGSTGTAVEDVLELQFSLFKGCYATSLLREYMKANILDY